MDSKKPVNPFQEVHAKVKAAKDRARTASEADAERRKGDKEEEAVREGLSLQIEQVRWRVTLAGCNVTVHQHLDGTLSLTYGPHRLGHYRADGVALTATPKMTEPAVEKTRRGKVPKPTFPPRLEIPPSARDSHFSTATTATVI